jgi:S1-C subfamily serine protease
VRVNQCIRHATSGKLQPNSAESLTCKIEWRKRNALSFRAVLFAPTQLADAAIVAMVHSEIGIGVENTMAGKIWEALSNEWAETSAARGQCVVAVQSGKRSSSGIRWSDDVVVSVHHGLGRDEEVTVLASPEEQVQGQIIGRDPSTDLAAIRLKQPVQGSLATWGDASRLRIGDLVLALARTRRGNIVASSGIVSGLMGPWHTWRGGKLDHFIRPDLTVYPGFSGGPLVNPQGEIVGLNTSGLHRLGLTIPAVTLKRIMAELLTKGSIERPYLGLAMQQVGVPESFKARLNLSDEAMLVTHVVPGSAAENSGILLGDLLVELEGQMPVTTEWLQETLAGHKPGEALRARLVRAGDIKEAVIVLQARPPK